MELQKMSVVKVAVVAFLCAILCLIAVVLLGWSLKSYWEFEANRKVKVDEIEKLNDEILNIEKRVQARRLEVTQIEVASLKYIELTNSIAFAEKNSEREKLVFEELKEKRLAIENEISALQGIATLSNSVLKSVCAEIESLKLSAIEYEKQKVAHVELEAEIVREKQELENLKHIIGDLSNKKEELESVYADLCALVNVANTNLSVSVERNANLSMVINEQKEAIVYLKEDVKALENRKNVLKKENDDLETKIRLLSPKEQTLVYRLSELVGEYRNLTNELFEAQMKMKQEVAEAKIEMDADTIRKNKDADEKLVRAKEILLRADVTAAEIVSNAKATAKEIEKLASSDKEAAERARYEKSLAEIDAEKAKKMCIEKLDKVKEATEMLAVKNAQIQDANGIISSIQEKIGIANSELDVIKADVASLRKTEEELSEAIALRQKVLKNLAENSKED